MFRDERSLRLVMTGLPPPGQTACLLSENSTPAREEKSRAPCKSFCSSSSLATWGEILVNTIHGETTATWSHARQGVEFYTQCVVLQKCSILYTVRNSNITTIDFWAPKCVGKITMNHLRKDVAVCRYI